MKVRVRVQFTSPGEGDWADMESLGRNVTDDAQSVRVSAVDGRPDWLAVEFTMPTETQLRAVDKIDSALRVYGGNRLDSSIGFPRLEAELARAKRKNERRSVKRRAMRAERLADEPVS
jgi:hypothetical protein